MTLTETALTDLNTCPWHPKTSRLLKAIEEQSIEAVESYLSNGVPVNGFGGAFNESPLHKAAQLGWNDGIELLLSNGADVYSKNHYDQTPLHYACASKSCKCVRLLLDAGCQGALHQQDKRGHTPLHDASARGCVKCVSLLMKAGASVNVQDINNEMPLHKAAKANSIPTMLILLNKGADLGAKDKFNESALSYLLRLMPGGIDTLLDHCLVTNTEKITLKKLEICFNFIPISGVSEKNQVKNLRDVVELGYPKLLLHPLCESYLLLKWNNVRRYFFFEVLFYFTYAILASLLILDKFVFDSRVSTEAKHMDFSDGVFDGLYCIAAIQAVIILLKECLMIVQDVWSWSYVLWHIANSMLAILTMLVLPNDRTHWEHHLASVVVLALWVQCMLHISKFPSCGIYVAMFLKVAKVFLRIFAIFFCLLLAFAMSFYVSKYGGVPMKMTETTEAKINSNIIDTAPFTVPIIESSTEDNANISNFSDEISTLVTEATVVPVHQTTLPSNETEDEYNISHAYYNPGLAFYKTLTMMIGELDFDNDFIAELNLLPGTSHVIFISFVILVSIILSNLLVALAVNDVQGLRQTAYLERLIKQMELVFQIDKTFKTMESLARFLNLLKFVQKRKPLMHDLQSARITLEPHHPQKGTRILIHFKGDTKEVFIKKLLVSKLIKCLQVREEIAGSGSRKMSIKRTTIRRVGNGPEEIQDTLKTVESFVSELSTRMEDLSIMFGSIDSRLKALEDSISNKDTTVSRSCSSTRSETSFEHNPLIMSREEAMIVHESNTNDLPV